MQTTSVASATSRHNRVLIALAAAWMIVSIALGGVVSAETQPGATSRQPITAVTP